MEVTKLDSSIIPEGKIAAIAPQIQAFNLQKAEAEGLMSLLRERGKGYLALCSHHGKEAVSQYLEPSSFSPPQYRLGTVPNWKGLF